MCDESTDNNSNNRDFRDSDSGLREQDDHEAAFNDLIEECKHNPPGARLSARLRKILERIRPEHRRDICSRTRDGCAPLFVACRRGNAEMVEYLVYVCNAELEQRGVYEVPHDRSTHSVTPLWCAAVAGRMQILRILADAGADINAGSDSGSTPVRSACFMTHLDVVKFLVERGADIHRPNYNGGTCLINSVQSVPLCSYLLQRGARVDARDMQLKTALHYAIQEHRLETVRLLLQRGASPHLRSRAGDDALRTACVKGATQVVSLLLSRVRYTPSRVADAYELLGATQLDEFNDADAALASWRRATGESRACARTRREECRASLTSRSRSHPPRARRAPAQARRRRRGPGRGGRGRAGRRGRVAQLGAAGGAGAGHRRAAHAGAAGGGARAGRLAQGRRVPPHVPGRGVRRLGTVSALLRPLDLRVADSHTEGFAAFHGDVPRGQRSHEADAGRDERAPRAAGRRAALRRRAASVPPGRREPPAEPARSAGAAGAQAAGRRLRPRPALRITPTVPAAGHRHHCSRLPGAQRARAAPRARRRAQRAHGRHAAAPVRVAPQRHALHVLRRADRSAVLSAAGAPLRGRGGAAAALRRRPARAQRVALDGAARGRRAVQLLDGAGGGAAGGRRAPGPAQPVRRVGGRDGAAEPRLARVRAAPRVAGVPGGARAAGGRRARGPGRRAARAAGLRRAAPRLSIALRHL
ncbi:tonsoku-like protein isoform X1 [Vanessa cardui]|uniref:tonsoku-like protein isoform X1 n=1 Tax=Vanessa cardui TaxID=171605 RepID=UPI001F12A4E6|nr:tonsoku-like protein isoform X1 [Vanessa cardui]